VLHSEVASALYGQPDAPAILTSFIGGLGGRDISAEEFYEMASITGKAAVEGKTPPPRLLLTERELTEIRKLQAIAQAKRQDSKNKNLQG
jgi:pyruvate ferredoxin oxidoreductase alpha subunit